VTSSWFFMLQIAPILDYQTYFGKMHTAYRTFHLFYEWGIEQIMANHYKFSYTSVL